MRKLNSQINSELSEAVWYSPVPNYKGKRFDKVESDLSTIPVLRRPFCFRFEVRKGICSVLVGLQPFIAENLERIRSPLTRPLHWNGLWWVYLEVSKKLFWKKNLVRCYGFLKRLDSGQITLFFVVVFSFIAGNLVSSGQHSRLNVSVILGVGVGVFSRCFEPLYLKNCWTYQNEHVSIRSSSAPFF